ncbi:glycylpeptide N-tetradecanoyltransferase 1 [Tachysurus ichikawai]
MADENETAPKQEKEAELDEDHGHCSDCENEEHHFDDGFIPSLLLPLFTSHFISLLPQKGFDVFNALDLMENKTFLEKLKFGIGDGNLQYYLYNWKCPSMGAEKVGLVLQ